MQELHERMTSLFSFAWLRHPPASDSALLADLHCIQPRTSSSASSASGTCWDMRQTCSMPAGCGRGLCAFAECFPAIAPRRAPTERPPLTASRWAGPPGPAGTRAWVSASVRPARRGRGWGGAERITPAPHRPRALGFFYSHSGPWPPWLPWPRPATLDHANQAPPSPPSRSPPPLPRSLLSMWS